MIQLILYYGIPMQWRIQGEGDGAIVPFTLWLGFLRYFFIIKLYWTESRYFIFLKIHQIVHADYLLFYECS